MMVMGICVESTSSGDVGGGVFFFWVKGIWMWVLGVSGTLKAGI